jgi:hypothetical protein
VMCPNHRRFCCSIALAQFRDGLDQSIRQLQQIASSPACPRSQPESFQLLPSLWRPRTNSLDKNERYVVS